MAENKKPASLRPAGFGAFGNSSTSKLTHRIAELNHDIEIASREELRSLGREKFLDDRDRELEARALAIALFGVDRCAGCKHFSLIVGTAWFGKCQINAPTMRGWPETKATYRCGDHVPVVGGR